MKGGRDIHGLETQPDLFGGVTKRHGLLLCLLAAAALLVLDPSPAWAGWTSQTSATGEDLSSVHFPVDATTDLGQLRSPHKGLSPLCIPLSGSQPP